MGGLFYRSFAIDSVITILPAPPLNAVATQIAPTEVQLTWDASPTLASSIYSYSIYYKLKTDPTYPVFPQITRTDSLASYSESIIVLPDTGYDFKIYANTINGLKSIDNCASCEASNAFCGNATIDPGEDCDGANLNGAVCADFGYLGGALNCSSSCQYQFNSCTVPHSGGGGGGPQTDSIKPIVGTLTAPQYANHGPIVVSYEGVNDAGGSGLDYIKFYYRKGVDPWMDSGLLSDQTSGAFEFYPPENLSDTYYFAIQAFDNQGNASPYPDYNNQTFTIYDNILPTIGVIDFPQTANGPIQITYKNALDPGITTLDHVELWYKKGQNGMWTNSLLMSEKKDGEFIFNTFNDSDVYYFDLVAVDLAGNRSLEKEESNKGVVYDIEAPIYNALATQGAIQNKTVIIHYDGATDVGLAGLAKVELWYKKEMNGEWLSTGLINTESSGNFSFDLEDGDGTYYFALVLTDLFGNTTGTPMADRLSVVLGKLPFEVVLSNLPNLVTNINSTNIVVAGENIVSYRYQINNGPYSQESPVEYPIQLKNLPEGDYQLNVIGKDINGVWQEVDQPTSYQWSIVYQTPGFIIVGPYKDENDPSQVTYMILYQGDGVIELGINDLKLNQTETAKGQLNLIKQGENIWQVNITGLSGEGELFFTISSSLKDTQGNALPPSISPVHILEDKSLEEDQTELQDYTELLESIPPAIIPKTPEKTPEQQALIQSAITAIRKSPRLPIVERTSPLLSGMLDFQALRGICIKNNPSLDFEDEALDSDGDGLSNRLECYIGTNPMLSDTDEDQCTDGDEVNWLDTDPKQSDCPFSGGQKAVWITSPQNNWTISGLDIMGLAPDDSSSVSLFLFPVINGVTDLNTILPLGRMNRFTPSSIKRHLFFNLDSSVKLKEGGMYELLATSVSKEGKVRTSPSVRFIYDSSGIRPPVPLTIGDRSIPKHLKLTHVHISPSDNGKVRVTGESEYGARVFAVWQSIVLGSSIVTDSQLGHFSIESPYPLETDQLHKVTLYALKEKNHQLLRSRDVPVNFYLHRLPWIFYLFIIILLRIIALFIIRKLQKNEKLLTNNKK